MSQQGDNMIQRILVTLTAALCLVTSVDSRASTIENIVDTPIPVKLDGSQRSVEEAREAIIAGCRRRGWTPVVKDDATIKCSILVRAKHYVEVDIPFSASSYSILYADSRLMDYDAEKQRIHRNFNKWIIMLSQTIQTQFGN